MPYKIPADQRCALISRAIEIDLRNLVKEKVLPFVKINTLISSNLLNKIKERILKNSKDNFEILQNVRDVDIADNFDYGTSLEIIISQIKIFTEDYLNEINEILIDLKKIKPIRDLSIHGRILLATELDIIDEFIDKITKKNNTIFSTTISQIETLKNKTFEDVYEFEDDERVENNNLPRPDTNETGYIERLELNQRINKVLNNYPVISFIGDAGTGKTATAIKKAYEISMEDKFDVIWYHTFKTEKFSLGEVRQLKNDINTSDKFLLDSLRIGIFDKDPIVNLVKYLEKNKVLLILDNLETVLDNNINKFLDLFAEADHESKVIITSRIPVSNSMAIKVGAFKDNEALDYFRKLINFYDLKHLHSELNTEKIKKLIKSRNNNPLHIKLSLAAVSGGKTIEDAFKENKDLLNFCYLNVFETLNENSRKILEYIYYFNRELNLSEITLIAENVNPNEISISLRDLVSKNFLYSHFTKSETSYFNIRKEIIPFIKNNKFFSNKDIKEKLFQKFIKMQSSAYFMEININRIDSLQPVWDTLLVRKESDKFAASQLVNTNRKIKKKNSLLKKVDYTKSRLSEYNLKNMELIDKEIVETLSNLKKTHPDYCEVYRVDATYQASELNYAESIELYEKAISLQPNYPNLRTFYATALIKLQDLSKAKRVAKENYELYPHRFSEIENFIIAKQFVNEIDSELEEAIINLRKILEDNSAKVPHQAQRKAVMRLLSFYQRTGAKYAAEFDYVNTFNFIKKTFENYEYFKKLGLVDRYTVKSTIGKTYYEMRTLQNEWRGRKELDDIKYYFKKIHDEMDEFPDTFAVKKKPASVDGVYRGTFYHADFNHTRKPGGGYIAFDDRYIEEYNRVSQKIYVKEDDLPLEIKKLKKKERNLSRIEFKIIRSRFGNKIFMHAVDCKDIEAN